uniref:Uncharacterized protein n=1 Tax=Anguilla anguilla TaxID=7936 RepID=A0A0E9SA83_ANGAN
MGVSGNGFVEYCPQC